MAHSGIRAINREPEYDDTISPRADGDLLDLIETKPLLELEVCSIQQETLLQHDVRIYIHTETNLLL